MSKFVKNLMIRDYQERLGDLDDALLISLRGINSNDTNNIRAELRKKEIGVTVIRNKLFLKAFEGRSLTQLEPLLEGSNAVAYGAESVVEVAREIVALTKAHEGLELRGAVLDGQLFEGEEGVKALSKYPTRDEAIAQNVALILTPGRNLVAAVTSPGARIVGIVKAIEERLEKGEEIKRSA